MTIAFFSRSKKDSLYMKLTVCNLIVIIFSLLTHLLCFAYDAGCNGLVGS